MPPKSRQPVVRSVRTPQALTALRDWLGTFDATKREEGSDYHIKGAVKEVWSEADHLVKARVEAGESLDITLFLTRGAWTSRCSCPILHKCEHVYAASLAWLSAVESGRRDGRDPGIILEPDAASATPVPKPVPVTESVVAHELATWLRALPTHGKNAGGNAVGLLAGLAGIRLRLDAHGRWLMEVRTEPDLRWKPPAKRWLTDITASRPADFEHLPAAEAALGAAFAAECRLDARALTPKLSLSETTVAGLLRTMAARPALVLPDGSGFAVQPQPLVFEAAPSLTNPDRLDLHLITPDGHDASPARLVATRPETLYLFDGRVWRGPPPAPLSHLPKSALSDARLLPRLRAAGVRLPVGLTPDVQTVVLLPKLRCWLSADGEDGDRDFHAQLTARSENPPCEQRWTEAAGWQWTAQGRPPARNPGEPMLEFDLSLAQETSERFGGFRLVWDGWAEAWMRPVTNTFPEEFIDWHAGLPEDLELDVSPELASLLGEPLRAHMEFSLKPASKSEQDWFDLSVGLGIKDTNLTSEEIALLLKERGKWVSLPRRGWRRVEADVDLNAESVAALSRLGLSVNDVLGSGRAARHRLHALQLAAEAEPLAGKDSLIVQRLQDRAAHLAALPPPPLPAGLRAELRPYQREGFLFLAHLSAHGFGGVLADDMGLGKTVQTLAWLLHLADAAKTAGKSFRALVVCPKSVTHGWLTETARFTPGLTALAFNPGATETVSSDKPLLLVANYTQLRLNAPFFQAAPWDAIVLDEGQFIKNPGSQVAVVARSLHTRHRVVLTGTPIENRLTDLWSLFAFAQPGLLGDQPGFRRQYHEVDPEALMRLHQRVRHFLLRRTKAQAAPDLPTRTEDDIIVELEGQQRQLYDAELKRARAQLTGVGTAAELGAKRFHVLASLLRLRQICCHPGLVDPAHASLPSAKLDALLERIEELADEGHQVLVFSQFVGMLEIIRARLIEGGIGHLILTGSTENRAELVDTFQTDRTKTVFLLSLKAAGFGLNLTAASYAILYDPWWNPAAEAQAIDRTHRIGQTRPVMAYRLIAQDTVEEKIRALQHEKSALAQAVIQEETVASVMDLESLKQILS